MFTFFKILQLARYRAKDGTLMREIINYQTIASIEEHEPDRKAEEYLGILARYPGSAFLMVLYKFVIAHKNFSNMIVYHTNPEYKKFGAIRNNWFLNAGIIFLAMLITIWGGAVEIAAATNIFADASVDGSLTTAAIYSAIAPFAVLMFIIASTVLLGFYHAAVERYRQDKMSEFAENTDSFFQSIEETFQAFACGILLLAAPSDKVHEKTLRMIKKEGREFNEEIFETCGIERKQPVQKQKKEKKEKEPKIKKEKKAKPIPVAVEEEGSEGAEIGLEMAPNESQEEVPVVEIAPDPISEEAPIPMPEQPIQQEEPLEEIFQKFEEMPYVPPPSVAEFVAAPPPPPPAVPPPPPMMSPPPPPMMGAHPPPPVIAPPPPPPPIIAPPPPPPTVVQPPPPPVSSSPTVAPLPVELEIPPPREIISPPPSSPGIKLRPTPDERLVDIMISRLDEGPITPPPAVQEKPTPPPELSIDYMGVGDMDLEDEKPELDPLPKKDAAPIDKDSIVAEILAHIKGELTKAEPPKEIAPPPPPQEAPPPPAPKPRNTGQRIVARTTAAYS